MKKLIIASAIAAATLSAPALADKKSEAYGACKAEVKSVLGSDTNVTLRKVRSNRGTMKVTMRIKQPNIDSMSVNCFYGENMLTFESNNQPVELAALTSESKDTAVN